VVVLGGLVTLIAFAAVSSLCSGVVPRIACRKSTRSSGSIARDFFGFGVWGIESVRQIFFRVEGSHTARAC
jgi:hypothetical protein